MRCIALILLLIATTTIGPIYAQHDGNEGWTPGLTSITDRVQVIQSLLEVHPNLLQKNLEYRRNLLEPLEALEKILNDLGEDAASATLEASERWSAEYKASGTELAYDDEKIKALKKRLISDVEAMPFEKLEGLEKDAAFLKESSRNLNSIRKTSQRWMRLVPFLYDAHGQTNSKKWDDDTKKMVIAAIESASASDLENKYLDLFAGHQIEIFKDLSQKRRFAFLKTTLDLHEARFMRKELRPTLRPLVKTATAARAMRFISLESVPPLVALYRGLLGADCSLLSVPYYPLVKGAKTYWLRKNAGFNSQPNGYAFVIPTVINGKTLPYIVTINGGTLTRDDVQQTINLVAKAWGTNEVLLPDFDNEETKWLVNGSQIRDTMRQINGNSILAEPPKGWDVAAAATPVQRYRNFYSEDIIKNARIVKVPNEFQTAVVKYKDSENLRSDFVYKKPTQELPLYDRALLAAQAVAGARRRGELYEEVRAALSLSVKQLDAAVSLVSMTHEKVLSVSDFLNAKEELGFNIKLLSDFDPVSAAHSIKNIYDKGPELAAPEVWKTAIDKVDRVLAENLEALTQAGVPDSDKAFALGLNARAALPPAHNFLFWENELPLLLRDKNPTLRLSAAHAINGQGKWPESIWKKVLPLLKSPHTQAGIHIIDSLKHVKVWPDEMWKLVPELLRSTEVVGSALVQRRMYDVLTSQETWPKEIWIELYPLAQRLDGKTGPSVFDSLAGRHPWPDEFWAQFPAMLADDNPRIRNEIFSRFKNASHIPMSIFSQLLTHENPKIVRMSILKLYRHVKWSPEVWGQVARLLSQNDPEITKRVSEVLHSKPNWTAEVRKAVSRLPKSQQGALAKRLKEQIKAKLPPLEFKDMYQEPKSDSGCGGLQDVWHSVKNK